MEDRETRITPEVEKAVVIAILLTTHGARGRDIPAPWTIAEKLQKMTRVEAEPYKILDHQNVARYNEWRRSWGEAEVSESWRGYP